MACKLLGADASASAVDRLLADPDIQHVLSQVLDALTRPGIDPDLAEDNSPTVDASRPTFWNRVYRFYATFTEHPIVAGMHITAVVIGTVTGFYLLQLYGPQIMSAAYRALRLSQFVAGIQALLERMDCRRPQASTTSAASQSASATQVPSMPSPPVNTPHRPTSGRRRVNLSKQLDSTSQAVPKSTSRSRPAGWRPSLADISEDEISDVEDSAAAYQPWRPPLDALSSDEVNLTFFCTIFEKPALL